MNRSIEVLANGDDDILATAPVLPWHIAFGNIDLMFDAVQQRIANIASDAFAADCAGRAEDAATRMRATVVECGVDLGQLHSLITHEAAQRRRLERTAAELQHALDGVQHELSRVRIAETAARYQASHDGLTLLPNAEGFRTRFDMTLAQVPSDQRIALMFLDLDGFKQVNDTHGHAVGDEVLRIVSARLANGARTDDLVSRVGGDEFACVLVGVQDRVQLGRLACQMLDVVSSPMRVGALSLSVRPSIGLVMRPEDGLTSMALLVRADAAMYRAKREGSGYAFFEENAHEPLDGIDSGFHSSAFDRMARSDSSTIGSEVGSSAV